MTQSGQSGSAVKAEDALPVVLYADHGPPVLLGLIEQLLGERAYLGVGKALSWPIGIFARRIIVDDEHFESRTVTGPGVFQHLLIAGRVAKRGNRTTPDHQVNALRLTGVIVVEEELRVLGQDRLCHSCTKCRPWCLPPVPAGCRRRARH